MHITIDHNHYFHECSDQWKEDVTAKLNQIKKQGETFKKMLSETEQRLLTEFDNATNEIAAELEALKKPDDDEFNARLESQIVKLKGLGGTPVVEA